MKLLDNSTIIVTLDGDFFVIVDPYNNKTKKYPTRNFVDSVFKYKTPFKRAFLSVFKNKKTVWIHPNADKKIDELIDFNRLDS